MVKKAAASEAVIVIDSREQLPYSFDTPSVCRKLEAGDYSVEGLEDRVAIERKSLDDFVSTVIRSRKRFAKELDRLHQYDFACIVVEADLTDIVQGRYRSGANPNSVLGATLSIIVDYGIPVYFCSNRRLACRFVYHLLIRLHRKFSTIQSTEAEKDHHASKEE